MKVIVALAALVAVASAGSLPYGAGPVAVSTGTSSQFRSEDNYGNYNFGYDEQHPSGGSSRREEQTNGVRRGSYALNDADGRRRVVNYVADASGFHADIQTNEPGVEPKDPADVLINKAPVAPAYAAPAPVALPAPVAAPVHQGYAPRALPLPAPVAAPAYAPVAPAYAPAAPAYAPAAPAYAPAAPAYAPAAPAYAPAAPAYAPAPIVAPVLEAPTPRAFSYSFGSTHLAAVPLPAPLAAPAPVYAAPAPLAPPAPVYQQRLEY